MRRFIRTSAFALLLIICVGLGGKLLKDQCAPFCSIYLRKEILDLFKNNPEDGLLRIRALVRCTIEGARNTVQIFDYLRRKWKWYFAGYSSDWVYVREGFWIKLDMDNWMDAQYFFGNYYEVEMLPFLEALLKPGDTCFDIGAEKGFFALPMAKLVGLKGRVFAFEPDSKVYGGLEDAKQRNKFQNLITEPLAVSDKPGKAQFTVNRRAGGSSFFPSKTDTATVDHTEEVTLTTIDDYVRNNRISFTPDQILLFKIDAEGSEMRIISGMPLVLASQNPVLIVEINKWCLQGAGTSAEELVLKLKSLGFELYINYLDNQLSLHMLDFDAVLKDDPTLFDRLVVDVVALRRTPLVENRLKNILPPKKL